MSLLKTLQFYASSYLEVKFLLVILTAIAISWLVKHLITLTRLPPGPWGLPIVGYVPWMGENAHETFLKIGKKYGGVFSINLGGETMIVLNDWPSIKATLVDQPKHFDGRAKNMFTWRIVTEGKNVGTTDGQIWVKLRKLAIRCLRGIGMGKKSMEGLLTDTAHEISTTLTKHDGNLIEMDSLFFNPILKLNWRMIASHNLDEIQLKDFEKDIDVMFKALRPDCPLNVFPWLRFISPNGSGYNELLKSCHNVKTHFRELIVQHLAQENQASERDFIDHYLDAMKVNNAELKEDNPPYDVEHLKLVMFDIFTAGVDTTNATLLWGFLYLACYPDVQKKVQMELDSIVGRQRLPNIDDLPRLPYFVATIMEIHRLGAVAPLAVPHRVTKTSKIYDYTIPKGMICLQNIYAVHRNPQLWDEPEVFRPERFLDEQNSVTRPPYLMPFSIGPRLCIGQDLSELMLRVFFSRLLHRFTFTLPKDMPKPTFEPDVGLTMKPFPYSLHVIARNE